MAVKKRTILFYLSHGHRQWSGKVRDMGAASGKFVEGVLTFKFTKYLNAYLLKKRGDKKYKVAYPEKSGKGFHLSKHMQDVVTYIKRYRVVAIDVHFNAGKGVGCECWIPKGNLYAKTLATYILREMVKLGRPLHGGTMKAAIHEDRELMWSKLKGTPLLLEVGYVDNTTDRKDFDTDKEIKELAEGVGKACIKYYNKYK